VERLVFVFLLLAAPAVTAQERATKRWNDLK